MPKPLSSTSTGRKTWFRHGLTVVMAEQFDGIECAGLPVWPEFACAMPVSKPTGNFWVLTPRDAMHASLGDWIITGSTGEHTICRSDIFAANYTAIEADFRCACQAVENWQAFSFKEAFPDMDTRHTWHFPNGTKVCCDYCDEQISGPELKKATWYLHPECAGVLAQSLILALDWTTEDFQEVLGQDPMDLLMAVVQRAIVHLKEVQ